MSQPWEHICPPSWIPLTPASPSHLSGLSQITSSECPVSFIKLGLVIYFTYGNIHVSVLFSQIIPPSPSPTESKSLFFISVSLLLSHIWSLVQLFSRFLFHCVAKVTNMEFRALRLLLFANSYLIVDLWWEMVSAVSLPPFWWPLQAASLSEALSPLNISWLSEHFISMKL